ncbi:MAG: hypothetical protein K2J58_05185 [Muribaculaceae bacterium]|nr:hypothetical protein [Muribaculaceae bacterium]
MKLCIKSDEVLADIRSAAWLEQELHSDLDRHRRHQMADICEPDNVERVWRVLGIAIAEIRLVLLKILRPRGDLLPVNNLERPSEWRFAFRQRIAPDMMEFLKEKIHESLVAMVMADRAAVIIPQCAHIWSDRAEETLSALRNLAATTRSSVAPVRRPLLPM